MSKKDATLSLQIHAVRDEARGIRSFDLRSARGGDLPPFTAGAHIDLILPNGLVRSYSLINPQQESSRYVIAVNRDGASRGGSAFVHDQLRVGDAIAINPPRNNFGLEEAAHKSLFIAGGIGITPIWCMIQRLARIGRRWELHYCARTRQHAPFLTELSDLAGSGGMLRCYFDHEVEGQMLDIRSLVREADPATHLYCCGPAPMLADFAAACAGRAASHVHLEYFSAKEASSATSAFTVVLARSNRKVTVEAGGSILRTLLDLDIEVDFGCQEGLCGTCETTVLEGIPDHRDSVLDEVTKCSNKTMMICCSGAKTDTIVLDL